MSVRLSLACVCSGKNLFSFFARFLFFLISVGFFVVPLEHLCPWVFIYIYVCVCVRGVRVCHRMKGCEVRLACA